MPCFLEPRKAENKSVCVLGGEGGLGALAWTWRNASRRQVTWLFCPCPWVAPGSARRPATTLSLSTWQMWCVGNQTMGTPSWLCYQLTGLVSTAVKPQEQSAELRPAYLQNTRLIVSKSPCGHRGKRSAQPDPTAFSLEQALTFLLHRSWLNRLEQAGSF